MQLYYVIAVMQLLKEYTAWKIEPNSYGSSAIAAVNIADRCFGSSGHWSELLVIPDDDFDGFLKGIHHGSKTSNSIVSSESTGSNGFAHSRKVNDYERAEFEWQGSKPTAFLIRTHSAEQLESTLEFLKNDLQRIWHPEAEFLIVLGTRCNLEECNRMFEVIWDHWILNAVILCSANDSGDKNDEEIELYTFNPYSADHSPQWEMTIHVTVRVSIHPRLFNHSWYIFKQRFTGIRSCGDCDDLFFDKTANLDGYVIPISNPYPDHLVDRNTSLVLEYFTPDKRMLETLSRTLRFEAVEVFHNYSIGYGRLREDGSYSGMMDEIYSKRSHFGPFLCSLASHPGLVMTYPHGISGVCLVSRIAGNWPQWTNLAVAKHIWITLGLGLIYSTGVLYLQNKSHGIVSAFLDAERFIIGNSIIRMPTAIKYRIFLGSILLVFLVVDGAIRGRFISILTIARSYDELETLEQIREQDVEVYAHAEYKGLMLTWVNLELDGTLGIEECFDSLLQTDHRRVCLTDCQRMQLELKKPGIHLSSEPIWSYYYGYLTAMHWPMTNRYSLEVQRLVEAGMFKKWQSDIRRKREVEGWKLNRVAEPSYVRPTRLNDLLPAFVLLLVGLSVALVVFAFETKGRKTFSMLYFRSRT